MKKTRKVVLCSLAAVSLFLPLISACSSPTRVQARLGQEFTLYLEQTAAVTGENLEIRFAEVVSDSRCPRNVTCIWAGEVNCLTHIRKTSLGTQSSNLLLVQAGLSDKPGAEEFDGYKFTFTVEPYPVAGKTTPQGDYLLLMTVTKLADE